MQHREAEGKRGEGRSGSVQTGIENKNRVEKGKTKGKNHGVGSKNCVSNEKQLCSDFRVLWGLPPQDFSGAPPGITIICGRRFPPRWMLRRGWQTSQRPCSACLSRPWCTEPPLWLFASSFLLPYIIPALTVILDVCTVNCTVRLTRILILNRCLNSFEHISLEIILIHFSTLLWKLPNESF